MQAPDIRRQFRRQHAGLAEAAAAARRRVAPQVREPLPPGRGVARQAPGAPPAAPDALGLLIQVFRQIANRRADLVVDRVTVRVRRVAQADEPDIEAAALQAPDLLGDESLGQTRIAFQHEGDRRTGATACAAPAAGRSL